MLDNLLKYVEYVTDSFTNFNALISSVFSLIPSPFKEILISAVVGLTIVILLKIKEKF